MLAAPAAFAAPPVQGGGQAEWSQSYDSGSKVTNVRSDAPILSPQTVQATEAAIQHYQQIVARGGFINIPRGERLRLGMRSEAVAALRRRLIQTGDLDASLGTSPVFDAYVDAAVKRFQGRHGLGQTGVVAAQTYAAMNTSARTSACASSRSTWCACAALALGNLGPRFVTINIPAGLCRDGRERPVVATRHAAGVGKIDRQSPIMSAKISEVNFNPFWTVPASVIKQGSDPEDAGGPRPICATTRSASSTATGQELAARVRSTGAPTTRSKYRFRQDQGGEFNSARLHAHQRAFAAWRLHARFTPAKGIFGDDFRFVSSGCVRVQNVRAYRRNGC